MQLMVCKNLPVAKMGRYSTVLGEVYPPENLPEPYSEYENQKSLTPLQAEKKLSCFKDIREF